MMLLPLGGSRLPAQTITLPTVRAFGPGPEEAMLYRLVAEVREGYAKDAVLKTRQDSTRVLGRMDKLLLAAITQDQLNRLAVADSAKDTLRILAGSQYMPDDPIPNVIRSAIDSIAKNGSACIALSEDALARLRAEASKQARVAMARADMRVRNARDASSIRAAQEIRTQLLGDTAVLAERNVRVSCALSELRERDPALYLSSLRSEAATAGQTSRALKLDSLTRIATQVVILRKLSVNRFFPIGSREQAAAFWRQQGIAPLNVGSIAGSSKSGVTFTELASPLLQVLRVSVNAVLAAEKDGDPGKDSSAAEIQRLLTGGGLLNVSFAYPIFYQGWNESATDVMVLLVPRVGATAPVLGATATDSATLNLDAGMELHAKLIDLGNGVGLVGQLRWANARGSGQFVRNLGIADKHNLTYATTSFGFMFSGQYLVTASRAIGGPAAIRRSPWQVGLTVIRKPTTP